MENRYQTFPTKLYCPHCKKWFILNLHIDKELGDFTITQEEDEAD